MIDQEKAIFIEYCTNCSGHVWCTKHDESRYSGFFQTVKQELEKQFRGFTIYSNTNPLTGKTIVPSLGAFEVFYMKRKIFSKLKTSNWPVVSLISSKIASITQGRIPEDCELVDYAYDDTVTEKKRKAIRIQKQLKRTFDLQNGSSRNDVYPATLSSLPTENQQEPKSSCWDRNIRVRSNNCIDLERKIQKRGTASAKPDKNHIKTFSQTMYSHKQGYPKVDQNGSSKINNENYFLPTKAKFGNATIRNTDPRSLNEMSLSLQTMTDLNTIYPSCPGSVTSKEGDFQLRKANNDYQFGGASKEKNVRNHSKLEPLASSATKTQALSSKTDLTSLTRQKRSHSQEIYVGPDQDQELNEFTMFSQRFKEPSSVKNRNITTKRGYKELHWFPEGSSHRSSPENFDEKIHSGTKIMKEYELIDPVFSNQIFDPKIRENELFIKKLKDLKFPQEKLSQIKVPRQTSTKKKITMLADDKSDSKIEVYFTHPEIKGSSSHQFSVAKGAPFKISLQFNYQEIKFSSGFALFIFKNDRPWQKILLDISFL